MFLEEYIHNLVVGIQHDDKVLIALAMCDIAGEYLEGEDPAAMRVFNSIWKSRLIFTKETRQFIVDSLPWECVAVKLAEESGLEPPVKRISEKSYPFWERLRPNPLTVRSSFEEYERLLIEISRLA